MPWPIRTSRESRRIIQLGQNELGVAPSPLAVEAAARAAGSLNRYPDPEHGRLRRSIAAVHGLRPEQIACGAGSMELMGLLATAYCEPGVDVVVSRHGYKYFELQCVIAGAALRVAPESCRRIDVDAILDTVTPAHPPRLRCQPEQPDRNLPGGRGPDPASRPFAGTGHAGRGRGVCRVRHRPGL